MTDTRSELLRRLPQVDQAARMPAVAAHLERAGRTLGLRLLRGLLEQARVALRTGRMGEAELAEYLEELPRSLGARVDEVLAASLRGVLNATGVVVHTNLGRAVLTEAARGAMDLVGGGYSNLEYDLGEGCRGQRQAHLAPLAAALFPGRKAMAVNNNAAAVLLALHALARGREVVVSRGELVEIGGSFRIPEILERSGAVLREVGTTNRTRVEDYRRAIGERTAAILKVHPSNYRILGFAEEAPVEDLARLVAAHDLPLLMDQGSGNLVDLRRFGVEEPTVGELLEAGADLVLFSGDKLLGGPQAGIAVGRADLVQAMQRSPLARALRLDKGTLAALEATLREYVRGTAMESIPVLRMIAAGTAEMEGRATALAAAVRAGAPAAAEVTVEAGESVVGGGAWPLGTLPTRLVMVRPLAGEAGALEAALRHGHPPVVARVERGQLVLDPRTLLPGEDEAVARACVAALTHRRPGAGPGA